MKIYHLFVAALKNKERFTLPAKLSEVDKKLLETIFDLKEQNTLVNAQNVFYHARNSFILHRFIEMQNMLDKKEILKKKGLEKSSP